MATDRMRENTGRKSLCLIVALGKWIGLELLLVFMPF